MADIKSMTLEQAQAYKKELKKQGKTESNSKEAGKVADYIVTLTGKGGDKRVAEAYRKLSSGVTEGGGWTEANAENIYKYTGSYPDLKTNLTQPKQAADVSSYLNSYQDGLYGAAGAPELRNAIKAELEPETAAPTPLNRVEEYNKMREENGVTALETQLTQLKADQEAIIAEKRTRSQNEEGKAVPLGVIGGRVSEIERQENERLDVVNRTLNNVVDQLQTSYAVIETYMNFMGLDYQDAVANYDKEYNRNLQIYNLVDSEMDEQEAAARANLQIYANAITNGNINYSSLSGDQKLFLQKLEIQSGLPAGFTANLKADNAGGKVLSTTTRDSGGTKYADIVMQMPDGSMKVVTQRLGAADSGGGSKETEAERARKASQDMTSLLKSKSGKDGYVSPTTWTTAAKAWVAETDDTVEDFAKKYGSYVNPKYSDEYLGYDRVYNY